MSSVNSTLRAGELDALLRSSEISPETPAERFFSFLESSETPFLHKIGAVTLPLILAVGASILMKFSLLGSVLTLVTAVVLTSAFYVTGEETLQRRAIDARVERAQATVDSLGRRLEVNQARLQEVRALHESTQRSLDELILQD